MDDLFSLWRGDNESEKNVEADFGSGRGSEAETEPVDAVLIQAAKTVI